MNEIFSIVEGLFLESPAPLVITLGLVGMVLMVCAANRQHKKLFISAIIAWCIAGSAIVTSILVTTDREEVSRSMIMLLKATEDKPDMVMLRHMLAPDVRLVGPRNEPWLSGELLIRAMEASFTKWPIASHSARETRTRVTDTAGTLVARVEMQLTTNTSAQDTLDRGVPTFWVFLWQRDEAGVWKVHEIKWLEIYGQPPESGIWNSGGM